MDMRFEPSGITDNPDIRFASSVLDHVARWLGGRFISSDYLKLFLEAKFTWRTKEVCGHKQQPSTGYRVVWQPQEIRPLGNHPYRRKSKPDRQRQPALGRSLLSPQSG
jgi:hypothetical protein